MRRIGLYLGAEPTGGGTFQFNQTMLDAVASLPSGKYATVVAYENPLWEKHLQAYAVQRVLIPKGVFGRAIGVTLSKLGVSLETWRKLCPYFHPMAKVLLPEKCDLWIFPSQDGWSYHMPVPALVAIYDLMHRYLPQFPEVAGDEAERRDGVYRNICRWAKGVMVDSTIGKEQVVESYGMEPERVHVLPFIAPKYIHATTAPAGFDDRYPLPPKFLFYPAQFWEHKNHKGLIRALAKVKGELPDVKLVLAGSKKSAYDSVLALVKELGLEDDVLFLGYVPDEDMTELYRRARAMVMPTFFGPTNIPPLEAFAAGCPAALSGIFGMPEQAGGAALLFDPASDDEIAGCLARLWRDDELCRELAEKGKQRAAQWGQRQFNERVREIIDLVVPDLART